MDLLTAVLWTLAGATAGAVAGLIPSLHPNTVAALFLGLAPGLGPAGGIAAVAAASAHAFTSLLPATYLGAPSDEAAMSVLPAHRMLKEGHGRDAVAIGIDAALLGTLAAVVLLLPAKWLLAEPGRLLDRLDAWSPWVVLAAIVLLLWGERRKGFGAITWSILVLLLSGLLGYAASHVPVQALLDIPATPLLPLLSGLFGTAGILASLADGASQAPQQEPEPLRGAARRSALGAVGSGIAASALTLSVSGLTSAVAATVALAGRRSDDPRPALAAMSAVNAAHATLAIGLLFVTLRPRTGIAAAVDTYAPTAAWTTGAPPPALPWLLAAVVAASLAGHALARRLDPLAARVALRVPARALSLGALVASVGVVAVLSGAMGLAILAASTVLGLVPLAAGVRRVHLTGCLLLPALARAW